MAQFQSEEQRKAVMASYWQRRHPFAGPRPQRSTGKRSRRAPSSAASRILSRQATDILKRSGFTAKGAPAAATIRKAQTERRHALRRALKVGLLTTAAGAVPAGYFFLRHPMGQRLAGRAIRHFRPLRPLRSFVGFTRGKAVGRAEEAVGAVERGLRRRTSTAISRMQNWLTGEGTVPHELYRQEREILSAMQNIQRTRGRHKTFVSTGRAARELKDVEAAIAKTRVGEGAIDRLDALLKRGTTWVGRKLRLPVSGPASPARAGAAIKTRERHLALLKAKQADWQRLLRRGQVKRKYPSGVTVEMKRLKSGAIRRRKTK